MILLIDDEESVRQMLVDVLDLLGYEVDVCGDGETAVAYYRNNWEDTELVILDLSLPTMTGLEAFESMRAINPEMKVVFMSGYDFMKEVQVHVIPGQRIFLQKPFTIQNMSDAISKLLASEYVSG